jgi:RNA-dependent RNA polymerase
MCANGVPESLMIDIFQDAVLDIQGMKQRVKAGRMTREDMSTIGLCSEVRYSVDDRTFQLNGA